MNKNLKKYVLSCHQFQIEISIVYKIYISFLKFEPKKSIKTFLI